MSTAKTFAVAFEVPPVNVSSTEIVHVMYPDNLKINSLVIYKGKLKVPVSMPAVLPKEPIDHVFEIQFQLT